MAKNNVLTPTALGISLDNDKPDTIVATKDQPMTKNGSALINDEAVPRSNGVQLKVRQGTVPYAPNNNTAQVYKECKENKVPLQSTMLKTIKDKKAAEGTKK